MAALTVITPTVWTLGPRRVGQLLALPVSVDWGNFGQLSMPSVLGHLGRNRKPENLRFSDGAQPHLACATNLAWSSYRETSMLFAPVQREW